MFTDRNNVEGTGDQSGDLTFRSRKAQDPIDRLDLGQAITPKVQSSKLDADAMVQLWRRLMGHYERELHRQGESRAEQARDEDFYDNEQWTAFEKLVLMERGQQPLTYNVIATTINWLLGTERRSRTDARILPRRKEGSQDAERKSELLKYLADVNRSEFSISRMFKDVVVAGIGWIESGVQGEEEGEPVYDRYESWRNMVYDSLATEMDLDDGRYIFRNKWVDLDTAQALFPMRKDILARAADSTYDFSRSLFGSGDETMDEAEDDYAQQGGIYGDGSTFDARRRVRLIEAWFRVFQEDSFITGGQFAGELFDRRSPGHLADIEQGRATVVRKVRARMHIAVMCEKGLLFMAPSPYRHNRYPFTPIFCYRRAATGLPYGVVRGMRDPQSDVNKRASKALHILSTRRIIMDKGAVDDINDLREEAARPDSIIEKNPGLHLEIADDRQLAREHIDLMSRGLMMIQQVGGVTDENMGRTTNATSGKAITARQDQGALATAAIFDNLRYGRQIHGEKMISLSEQFISTEKQIRITDKRGNPAWVSLNDGDPANDITRFKADFVISEDDWNATLRQAQVEELLELMGMLAGTAPQIVLATLDLLVETMDVPQREELVKRIRQITGAEDPDADPNNPDPETVARKEQEAKQAAMAEEAAGAELATIKAKAREAEAKADKTEAETQQLVAQMGKLLADLEGADIDQKVRAMEAAAAIMANRHLSGVADSIVADAEAKAGALLTAGAPAAQPAPQPPQPMPMQAPAQPPMPAQGGIPNGVQR
ncbi:hypothetical protein [Sagittula salina]|uniref:Portal protein n=1 Tax=Sagittula salina TaxID=2820268 RepID=A0A940MRU3_9RHOB|nr:hypothetical protein [Sagittula salina]MBP0484665.1 hypothetical protein [Sagittula salina]